MFPLNSTSKMTHKHVSQRHSRIFLWLNTWGYTQAIKTIQISACVVRLGVPRCRNFVVYPTDKYHPSVLHMVSKRTLAYNFLYIFFCMNEIENMKHIVGRHNFALKIKIMQK